jgi:hypothetical protein
VVVAFALALVMGIRAVHLVGHASHERKYSDG